MGYPYMINIRVSAVPFPFIPVANVQEYEQLVAMLYSKAEGELRFLEGGLTIEEVVASSP